MIATAEARLTAAMKGFRRLYADAGYWMKGYLAGDDYAVALALAPEMRDKYTLLTQMRDLGELDRYL